MSSLPTLPRDTDEGSGLSGTEETAGQETESRLRNIFNPSTSHVHGGKCTSGVPALLLNNETGIIDKSQFNVSKKDEILGLDICSNKDKRYDQTALANVSQIQTSNVPLIQSQRDSGDSLPQAGPSISNISHKDTVSEQSRKPAIPSPLNLPKRFVIPPQQQRQLPQSLRFKPSAASSTQVSPAQKEATLKDKKHHYLADSPIISPINNPLENSNININKYQNLQPIQQMQQMQQTPGMPPYQQLFYDTQTGQVVTLVMSFSQPMQPIQASTTPQQLQEPTVMLPLNHTIPSTHDLSATASTQTLSQQLVYMRAPNGQLISVMTPTSSHSIRQPQNLSGSPLNSKKRSESISSSSTTTKRHKPFPTFNTTLTRAAEKLQRQQIQLQAQRHPNLNNEFKTTNISDVFVDQTDSINTSSAINSASTNFNPKDEIYEYNSTEKQNDLKSQPKGTVDISKDYGEQEKNSFSRKVIGTLTLGSFTYKYSQTLSGNLIKDKELFGRLADNAWKACIAKR